MNSKFFTLSLFFSLLLTACGVKLEDLVSEQKIKATPDIVQKHAEKVDFTVSAVLPADKLKKGYKYTLKVNYSPKNAEPIELGELAFVGDNYTEGVIPKIEKSFSMEYDPNYDGGDVKIIGELLKEGGSADDIKKSEAFTIAKGVITTSDLPIPVYSANFIASDFRNTVEYAKSKVEFFFDKGKSNLKRKQTTGEQAVNLTTLINSKPNTKVVNVTGMHSPEGSEKINSELARNRPETAIDFYKNIASKADYGDEVDKIEFVVKPVIQDWSEFMAMLKEYDGITDTQKNEIFSILNGAGDFVTKELKLKKLRSYRKVLKSIYPKLRNSRLEIVTIVPKRTDAEIASLSKKAVAGEVALDTLSMDELCYAADLTPTAEEKVQIYSKLIEAEDQYNYYNNLGATYLTMSKTEADQARKEELIKKGLEQLEFSIKKQANPEAFVNLAGARLMLGDIEGANEAISKVSSVGATQFASYINSMKGYITLKSGNYEEAVELLSSTNDSRALYNKGLAHLLISSKNNATDFSKAKQAFNDAVYADDKNAHAYYGLAVIAAKQKDQSSVLSNLSKVVDLDNGLRQRAIADLEFSSFQNDPQFKAVLVKE